MKAFLTILVLGIIIVGVIYLATDEVPLVGRFFRSSDDGDDDGEAKADAEAALALYEQARKAKGERAVALYEQAASKHPDTWAGREASLWLATTYDDLKRYKEALAAYERSLPNLRDTERDRSIELAEALGRIHWLKAKLNITDDDPANLRVTETDYTVLPRENFTRIAKKFGMSVEQIKIANGRSKDFLREGERIHILRKMPFLIVSKGALTLELHFDGKLLKTYRVGIGKDDLTPAGSFTVAEKQKDPVWYRPGRTPIPNKDPGNILGSRWMTLVSGDGVRRGYGIHGTTVPSSVPGRRSKGCIRMLNADVEELFEWVPSGTQVVIKGN